MLLDNPLRFNIYEIEKKVNKGATKFIEYLDNIYELNGIDELIGTIKSSGINVNIFGNEKIKTIGEAVTTYYLDKLNADERGEFINVIREAEQLESIVSTYFQQREGYFSTKLGSEYDNHVVDYIITLEKFLGSIQKQKFVNEDFQVQVGMFDSAIESSGMILKHFMHKNYKFERNNKLVDDNILSITENHIYSSIMWNEIENVIDYWKYSKLVINKDAVKEAYSLEIVDSDFEYNKLISNGRFNNLKSGWEMSNIETIASKIMKSNEKELDSTLRETKIHLNYLFASLYFGSPLLDDLVEGIPIHKWLSAYQLLVDLSKKSLLSKKNAKYRLQDYCICKTKKQWKEYFKMNKFKSSEFETIFNGLVFNNKSQDLVDCPFIKTGDLFVILPTLVSNVDISRALASNFLNRKIETSFRGNGFEERMIAGFRLNGIPNARLHKRDNNTEYECDVAFLIGNDLFFVECKAHVQPFSTRQHANHLYKLYEETKQLTRISDYFSVNLEFVREKLKLERDFLINNIYNILITTSMIGTPLYYNNVYIVDESSFSTFIDRVKPSVLIIDKDKTTRKYSEKYKVYDGTITTEKMIDYLNCPPQIEIFKDFIESKTIDLELFKITRHFEVNSTLHIGDNINKATKDLLKNHYSVDDIVLSENNLN